MDDKTILLKIELDTTSLTEGAKKAEENLKKLTPELDKIGKEVGKNTLEYKKLNAEVKANQKTLTDNATALQKYEALQKSNNGSLKEMRSLLSASKVAYAELTKEERENADVGSKLVKEMDALNNELLEAEKMYGTHTRNVGNYAGALTDLKAEIKSLKGQMATMDAGSEEYQQAALRAGELNDKLKEVNEATKANTGGTGFEKMSNNLGMVKDDLMNLDFAGVSEKMKQMAVISKSMTFGEVLGGLKNMGSALLNLGKAILTNPLFLMVGAIVAIGVALKAWNDSVNEHAVKAQQNHTKSIEDTISALKKLDDNLKELDDLYIRRAELEGKSTKEIGDMRIKALKDEHKRELQIRDENYKLLKSLGKELRLADSKESADAIREKIKATQEANAEIYQNDLTFGTRLYNLQLEINNQIADENEAHNEKIKQQNETAYNERLALARRLRDLQLENLELSNDNERAVIESNYKFLEDTAQGNADELLRIEAEKNKALNDLDKKEKDEQIARINETAKREIEDRKKSLDAITVQQIESGKKKDEIISEIEKQQKLELEAVDIEYKNKATERENAHTQKVLENQKLRAENERKTASEIELIDAQLAVIKARGTDAEMLMILQLYGVKKKQLEEQAQLEIKAGKSKELAEKELQLKIQQLQDETFKKNEVATKKDVEMTKQQKKDLAISAVNSASQLADSLMQISRNQIQTELNEDKEKYDAQTQLLNDQLQLGIISQSNFNAQKSVLDSEYLAKEKELKEKQFKSNKASQLINATIATAVGVASALAAPPPVGLIMAGIAGALGATQIALIASQPTPKFAKGLGLKNGIFGGRPHSSGGTKGTFEDGTQIEVEKDEAFFILNKNATPYINQLSALNESTGGIPLAKNGASLFYNGGVLQPMTNAIDSSFQMQNAILQAMQSMPSPVVAVEEIVNAVGRRTSVVERANF